MGGNHSLKKISGFKTVCMCARDELSFLLVKEEKRKYTNVWLFL
jgi:hypothetical protein